MSVIESVNMPANPLKGEMNLNHSVGQKQAQKMGSSERGTNVPDIDPFGKMALVAPSELVWG